MKSLVITMLLLLAATVGINAQEELNTIRTGGIWYKKAEIHVVKVKFTAGVLLGRRTNHTTTVKPVADE